MLARPRLQLRTSNVSCTVATRCVDTDREIPLDEQYTTVDKYSIAGRFDWNGVALSTNS